MRYTKHSLAVLSVVVALLLGLLWTILQPLQTADIVGIVSTVIVHILVTLVADWLLRCRLPLYTMIGIGTTAALYWLSTLGVAVVWRLLLLVDSVLLVAVQTVLLVVFVMLGWLFWQAGKRMEAQENATKGMD